MNYLWFVAIIAMLCWSGSDIFSKIGSPQNDKNSHFKVGIAVGLVMGLHAIYMVTFGGVQLTLQDIINYLPASALYILSMVIGYIGLRYIELSISSPICNGSGAVAAIMSMIFFGVTFNPDSEGNEVFLNIPIIIGILLIVAGIISLGIVDNLENPELRAQRQLKANRKYAKSVFAILLPVLYCIIDSLGTFVDTLIADGYSDKYEGLPGIADAELYAGDVLNTAYEFTWMFIAIIFAYSAETNLPGLDKLIGSSTK